MPFAWEKMVHEIVAFGYEMALIFNIDEAEKSLAFAK